MYRVKIYQINSERDRHRFAFAGSDELPSDGDRLIIDASVYDEVFNGELDSKNPEELFELFMLPSARLSQRKASGFTHCYTIRKPSWSERPLSAAALTALMLFLIRLSNGTAETFLLMAEKSYVD